MEFIREKIKEKPISRKRVFQQLAVAILCGILFAVTACMVLLLCMPMLQNALLSGVPMDTQQESSSRETEDSESETETGGSEKPDIPDIVPDYSLTIEDYQELQDKLYAVGKSANSAVVAITSVANEENGMNQAYGAEAQGCGVIVSEDSNYYYVLTEKQVIQEAGRVHITFVDGMGAEAAVLKHDGNTGVTILAVEKRQISEETAEDIAVITFGNSYAVGNGAIVIAIGNPLGDPFSILTGNVTSNTKEVATLDKNYDIYTTNIIASENGGGFLLNTKGELVGMVFQSFQETLGMNTLTAVSISEINGVVQRLIQGKDMPYVGLQVSTVTKQLSTAHNLPMGVFIKEVMTDSPAMFAGLQSGDIITHINGEEVYSDATYSSKIQMLLPGTTCEITVRRQNGDSYMEIKCVVQLGVLQ